MKKSIISGMLACILLLTGCVGGLRENKIPVNIGFRPVIGHDTRADESVPFPEDRTFRLWAQEDRTGSLYLDDETIRYNGGWLASKIWPEDKLTFEACWPMDIPASFSKKDGIQIKGFDCSGGDVDIMMAKAYDRFEIDSLVTLRFDHILSRVEFRMLHSLSEEMSVRLKKIEMKGFALKGDYNTDESRAWDVAERNMSYVVYDAGESDGIDISAGEAGYIGRDFYVIPQICTAALDIACEVRFGQAAWIPQTYTIESVETTWEPSKHYTYTLNLRMDKMVCTTGISSWNNRD